MAIQAGSSADSTAIAISVIAILLYPVGLVLLFGVLLFLSRGAIKTDVNEAEQAKTPLSDAVKFLYGEYLPHAFYWELIEMSRRFVLVGAMVLVKQGSMEQLAYGAVVSVIYLLLQTVTAPYRKKNDEFLASACSFLLVVLFLSLGACLRGTICSSVLLLEPRLALTSCAVVYKNGILIQVDDLQNVMSIEQKADYNHDYMQVTWSIFASCVGALVALGVIMVTLGVQEARRRRREDLTSRARRLRYTKNGREVDVQALPAWASWLIPRSECSRSQPGPHHIFLSHNWAQVCVRVGVDLAHTASYVCAGSLY